MSTSSMGRLMPRRHNQQGIVSLIITMIIMIVMSLILLGFSQLARREQRQALDRQLSSQALYAAESGVNIARRYLVNHQGYTKSNCDEESGKLENYKNLDGATGNVKISCLLITDQNTSLQFDTVLENKSTVTPVIPSANLATLTITWKDANKTSPSTSVYSPANLPTRAVWGNNIGILRIDLVPTDVGAGFSTALANTYTAFLRPSTGAASSPDFSTDSDGLIRDGSCTGAGVCTITISGLSAYRNYALRMVSIYNPVSVEVAGKDGLNNTITLSGQPQIDVTARAADVLRRIRVRAPSGSTSNTGDVFPEFSIDSAGGICKQLSVSPNAPAIDGCSPVTPGPTDPTPQKIGSGTPGIVYYCNGVPCVADPNAPPFMFDGPLDKDRWAVSVGNNTALDPGITVNSCTWDMGGTRHTTFNRSCNPGQSIDDYFYEEYYPDTSTCHEVNVSLTVNLSSGETKTTTVQRYVPAANHFPKGGAQFPNQPCG